MYFCDLEKRESKELAQGVRFQTFWGENMMMSLLVYAPDTVAPMHSHPQEQVGIIVEGEATFTIGGESRRLRQGEMYIAPGGVQHSVQAHSQGAKVLAVFNPIREE